MLTFNKFSFRLMETAIWHQSWKVGCVFFFKGCTEIYKTDEQTKYWYRRYIMEQIP